MFNFILSFLWRFSLLFNFNRNIYFVFKNLNFLRELKILLFQLIAFYDTFFKLSGNPFHLKLQRLNLFYYLRFKVLLFKLFLIRLLVFLKNNCFKVSELFFHFVLENFQNLCFKLFFVFLFFG